MSGSDDTAPREAAGAGHGGGAIAAPAIRGSLWTLGGYAVAQVLRLASNLVLTRLLFPEVFGQMALVFIFIQGLQMFSDVGTGPAIVQHPRGDEASFLNTAWTIQVGRGVALWLASWAIAWPVSAFYRDPLLAWLVPAAGLTALAAGFESTAMHTLQRHLKLERLTLLDIAAQVVGIATTVGGALLVRQLRGPQDPSAVWAIVGGSVVASVVRTVLSHTWLPGVRNRFHLDRSATAHLFRFGRWIFVSTLLTFLAGQSDRLVFGKTIPLALFGVYSIAAMLASLPTQAVLKLGGAVVFPAYSRLAQREDFPRLFWSVRLPMLLGGAAIVSALVAAGPFLVRALYDRRYVEAGWILQYLSAAAWFQILECTNGAALLARGHVKWVAAGSAAKVAGMAIAIPVGFRLGGFPGAMAGLVAAELAKYAVSALGAAAAGLKGVARDLLVTAAVAAVSAAAFGAGQLVAGPQGRNLLPLLAATAIAVGFWGVLALRHLRQARAARAAGGSLGAVASG